MRVINHNIYIESGLMKNKVFLADILSLDNVVIVTDNLVPNVYVEHLCAVFYNKNIEVIKLPPGEDNKNFLAIETLIAAFIRCKVDRFATLIALGGGVVGDLTGFAAAIYMRGIDWIQIPTTLIAQVDSAYGGKTGCNYQGKKNLLGAFHFPKTILVDPEYLKTLSNREYLSGLAEVVKYGMACDKDFFAWLEANKISIKNRDAAVLQELVAVCCEIKTNIVALDPRDQKERMVLNFGHSFGHALEAATSFSVYLHGEAVAIGMLLATRLAVRIGMLERSILGRLHNLLEYFELPTECASTNMLCDYIGGDKKNRGDTLNLILPYALGRVKMVSEINIKNLEGLLQSYVE
jgi:3-dehydroquinate synthase